MWLAIGTGSAPPQLKSLSPVSVNPLSHVGGVDLCSHTGSTVDDFVYVREGSALLLTCPLGDHKHVEWIKDDKMPIASDQGRVWLLNVNHTHEGEYTCSYGKQSHNYYLITQCEC